MARMDIFSETNSIVFQAISTPRRIRLYTPSTVIRPFDWVSIAHRGDGIVYAAFNGSTAASTAGTTVQIATNLAPIYAVYKTAPLQIFTHATSLSLQSQGSAVTVGIILGRF